MKLARDIPSIVGLNWILVPNLSLEIIVFGVISLTAILPKTLNLLNVSSEVILY